MKKRKKGIIAIILYVVIMFILSDLLLSRFLSKQLLDKSNNIKIYTSIIYNLVIYIIIFIPLILNYKLDLKTDIKLYKENTKSFSNIIFGFIVYFIANILASILSTLIYKDSVSVNQETIEIMINHSAISALIMFISVCILGPIVEELVFRKAFFDIFPSSIATILSSISFCIIHITTSNGSFRQMLSISLPYLICGIVLALLYEKNNHNIIITIVIHMLINLFAMAQILF